jgi:16S rRNA (adenine1518-N6/adenine1519-N6)-dimethyltransferase
VPPESFDPQPKVDSAIVRLTPHNELPFPCENTELLSQIVAQSFSQRRKTLRNNLKKLGIDEAIEQSGIDTSLRPENIPVADYVKLCNIINFIANQ